MPADEVTHGSDAHASRGRTGPRHAAPKKPLFTRFHGPAGKAIALAAMPTAVLMGMGFTPTLASAADHSPSSKNLSLEEYQKCVETLDHSKDSKESKDASPSPSPSSSASASAAQSAGPPEPTPAASVAQSAGKASAHRSGATSGRAASPDAGSAGRTVPKPSKSGPGAPSGGGTSMPSPSAAAGSGNLLGTVGRTVTGVLSGGSRSDSGSGSSAGSSATPRASSPASTAKDAAKDLSGTVQDTARKVTGTVADTVQGATDPATKAPSTATSAAVDPVKAAEPAAASPSPSSVASSVASPPNCPAATGDEGGLEQIVALPDKPWQLEASSLLLRGTDYQGVVKVRTADGTVKKVLKYVISDGTDIGDLHQLVDGANGVTYHVQAAKGSISTIRDGKTVMYTERISGNLFGLIPTTFSPDSPPPLNIPLIYFTDAKVTQAGQFGGTLTVPGMHQYSTGGG